MRRPCQFVLLLATCAVAPRLFAGAADGAAPGARCAVTPAVNASLFDAASRRVDATAPCRDSIVAGFALDGAYAEGTCDPASHPLPRFEARDFLAPCAFADDVRRVFFVVAHTALEQVARLVNRLSGPGNQIVLHVEDSESPATLSTLLALVAGDPTRCLVRSLNIVYLTASDVEVITAAFNWALEVHPGWTHFIPLTGQDYPLYGSAELARRIDATGQRTLVPSEELRCSSPNALAGQTFRGAAMYDEGDHAAHSNDDVLMNEMQFPRMMCYLYPCSITNPSGGSGGKAAVETWQRSPWVFTGIKGAPPVLSQFCKSHTMSSGVFAREAVRFLVTDPSARSAYTFFHRAGLASVEHYWPSTLLSLRPDLTFLGNGTLMSWDQGVGHDGTAATLDRVHNSFLTMAESGLIRAAFDGGALFARKFRTANSDVLDWIEALDGSAARAARARQRRQAAEAKR